MGPIAAHSSTFGGSGGLGVALTVAVLADAVDDDAVVDDAVVEDVDPGDMESGGVDGWASRSARAIGRTRPM
jgi:hypothetical protein